MREKSDIKGVDTANDPTSSILSAEGELPSAIVYSSKTHVDYIPHEIDYIKETLRKKGFKVKELANEIGDYSRYSDEFVKIADECIYGVIVLDGFRPNVLFEFGILVGLNKPISILSSDKAFIAVIKLYENNKEAGLSAGEFERLKNPTLRLGTQNHFSDLSTHISQFKTSDFVWEEEHVSKKMEDSIEKKLPEIIEEFTKVNSRPEKGINPEYLPEYRNILTKIAQYYTHFKKYREDDIVQLYRQIKDFEEISGIIMPSISRKMVSSLFDMISKRSDFE